MTGALEEVNTAFAADAVTISDTKRGSGATISGLGDQDVELTDTSILAADLDTLNGYTTGNVDVTTVDVMEGSIEILNNVYAGSASGGSDGISGLGNEAVIVTDTQVSDASTLVTLNSNTLGLVTADLVTEISGSASDLNNLLTSGNDLSQFTADSFSLLETVDVIDSSFSVEDLNSAIDQAKESTGDTNAVFSLVSERQLIQQTN